MSDVFALNLDSVSVSYGMKSVVDKVNLSVKSGEVFGLMGLNGAGKTTIIKSILGLRDQNEGTVEIYGQPKLSKASKACISYLPEKFEPPHFLTGMEFLAFSLRLYNQPFDKSEMIMAAESLALNPTDLDRRVNLYSKGMRQKLGLMGTLLTGASLFILDEPMSGLDPRARANVKKTIDDMRHKERTIFLSSHVLADMDEICDRVALLHNGVVSYVGTPNDLKISTRADNLEQAFLEYIESA